MAQHADLHEHSALTHPASFRVLELLPGEAHSPVACLLHHAEWASPPSYQALSYAWGDPAVKVPVLCEGRRINVTVNLHEALLHIRYPDRSRLLWIDALWCVRAIPSPKQNSMGRAEASRAA
jgi:hypothetical protein